MNAITSGPTPTPAAATVAACSTSRLMPRRWVSLPARRITYRSRRPVTSTRKFRFVIPPDRAVSVRSAPASSGTRCIARTSSSRSSPRRTAGAGSAVSVIAWPETVGGGAPRARRTAAGASRTRSASADHGLAGRLVGLDDVLSSRLRDQVVDDPDDEDQEDSPCRERDVRQPRDRVPARCHDLQGRVGRVTQPAPEVPEQVAVLPQGEVQCHDAAPDQREDVDDEAPATELEPRLLAGPAAKTGDQDAGVAQQVAQVDQTRGTRRQQTRAVGDEER